MKLKMAMGEDWFNYLTPFLKSQEFKEIEKRLAEEMQKTNSLLVPSLEKLFEPFRICPLKDLRVVLLNDCPIKKTNVNDGLAFSCQNIGDIPDETKEFFDGIEQDVYDGFRIKQDYDYRRIAKQGVLMLNYSMTLVYKELGLSKGEWIEHYDLWQPFIEHVLLSLCKDNKGLIFIICGRKPRDFASKILMSDHYLFTITHPRDALHFAQQWDTAGVFSLTNQILLNNNNFKIEW